MISSFRDIRRPDYRGERAEAIRSKRVDMLWIWSVYSFGDKLQVIAVSKNQLGGKEYWDDK
jgi:hypothetical protein